MNRLELAASILIVTLPLAAQTPATPAVHPAATITAPPAGFAQTIVLWPDGAPLAQGTTEGDIPKLFTYPTTGAGPHSAVIVFELGPHGTHMGEGLAPALHELTVTPTLIGDWMQLHGWMATDAQ